MRQHNARGVLLALLTFLILFFFTVTPAGRGMWNSWWHGVQRADDATRYATRKQVEDHARAMLSSYVSDSMAYRQYRNSESKDMRSVAEQAKLRANQTAAAYNEYVLKNSYVWQGNVPLDIVAALAYLE